jgi:hypothetical protein
MDMVGDIVAYENGEMGEEEVIDFFQRLLDTGMVYHLQGHYQRTVSALLDAGKLAYPDQDVGGTSEEKPE